MDSASSTLALAGGGEGEGEGVGVGVERGLVLARETVVQEFFLAMSRVSEWVGG